MQDAKARVGAFIAAAIEVIEVPMLPAGVLELSLPCSQSTLLGRLACGPGQLLIARWAARAGHCWGLSASPPCLPTRAACLLLDPCLMAEPRTPTPPTWHRNSTRLQPINARRSPSQGHTLTPRGGNQGRGLPRFATRRQAISVIASLLAWLLPSPLHQQLPTPTQHLIHSYECERELHRRISNATT